MSESNAEGRCPKCGGSRIIERWTEDGEERAEWLACIQDGASNANDCDGNETEPWEF